MTSRTILDTILRGDNSPDDVTDADRLEGKTDERKEFLVNYRNRVYDIADFFRHHPGGRTVFGNLRNRNLDKALTENPHSKSAFHLLKECVVDKEKTDQDYEAAIDWTQPILWQVGKLQDQYWEWVNLPVNRQIRLFQSDFWEYLSLTPWYLIPIVWIPLCTSFLYAGCLSVSSIYAGDVFMKALISYVLGFLLWTVLEYLLHRKLFHFQPPENSKMLITIHFLIHGVHHKAPFDEKRLVFPPALGLLVAKVLWHIYEMVFPETMIYFIAAGTTTGLLNGALYLCRNVTNMNTLLLGLWHITLHLTLPVLLTTPMYLAFLERVSKLVWIRDICFVGYLCYDLMHYYLHHGAPKFGTYMYTMKRNHNYHHFIHHDRGFGISSELWDHVFQTDISLRRLAKPIEW